MPSIAELRSALGAFAEDKNDEQLLQMASTAMGVSPGRIASEYGYKPTSSGIAGLRTGAAIDQYQAGLYGLGEAVTGADFFRRGREANEFESNVALDRARAQGAIGSFEEVQGLSDVPSYLGGLAIGSAPYMLEALGGGLAARGLMTGTRAALGAATAGGDAAAAARAAGTLRAGQTAGGVAAAYPSAVGGILQAQREQAGETDLGAAAALGVPFAGLNALGIEGALARQQMLRSGIGALDNLQGFSGGLARAGATGLRTGLTESGTETLQEMTSQIGRMAVDPSEAFLSDAALGRYKESAIAGGLLGGTLGSATGFGRSEGYQAPMAESDLTKPLDTTTRPDPSQFVTQDQTVGLKKFIDVNTGVVRPSRKDYEKQFEAAFNEPSGQFVSDAATGVERELTVGELMQRGSASMDLTKDKPADTAAAATAATKVATTRDPRDVFLRDELKVVPNNNSRQLFTMMEEQGIDPTSPAMVPVWNYAAAKYMTPSRLTKATELMDKAIIESRKEATSGTGISTVQQPAGGVGVGSPVVQGTVGDAGRVAPVAGAVDGGAPAAGAPLQQTGILSVAPGQPSTTVTTTAPAAAPAPETRFRRAPRPMTVLESARAAQAAQAQQTETQGQTAPAAAGPVVDERQAILQQVFGERDGNIIFDVVGMGMPEPEAAAKYDTSRSNIQKIAGATGQKTWPERIAKAKAQFGLTDAQIADAFNTVAPDSTEGQIASQVFAQSQERMDENEAIEAGLGNIVKTAGASTGAVEGFTKLQKEIDATLEALAVETDPAVLADLNAKLTAQIEKVKAVEKQAQAEVRALAGRKSDKETSEEAAAKAEQPAELGAEDAVQVESPAGVSVQPEAGTGEKVGRQVRRAKKPAAEGKAQVPAKVLTEAEQAAQAWDVVAADFPEAPKFADLTKAQQNTFIEFGPDNWERGDVELELTKLAKGGMKFGKEGDIKPAVAKNPYTAKELLAELKDFIRADIPGRKLLIVDSIEDLLRSPDKMVRAVGAGIALEGAYGVAVNGRAYLIANRIQKGAGRAKFMHEVGAHLGLEKLLPKAQYDKLTQQILNWAKKDDGSIESELALNAVERVQAAGTKQEDRRSEMLAYFIEEAMEAGIDPIAGSKSSSALTAWFRTLWAAFKVAARKLGFKPESMNAQDVVNLAFGAARLEINGTWHGTAADFRKFSNAFMGTGEGAQAYGWGTYLAQRTGIAKGYWSADVDRKTANPTATYDGRPLKDIDNEIGVKEQFELDLNEEEQALSLILPRLEAELAFGNNDAVRDTLRSITKDSSGPLTGRRYKQASDWFNKNYSKFKVVPGKKPEGTLMRVDTAITPEETLDWDRPLSEQPAVLEKLGMLMPEGLQEALADQYQQSVEDIGELTGEDLYRGLRFLEKNEGAVSEFWGIDDYVGQPGKKVASLFLDSMGIKGIQFLDAKSRGGKRVVYYDGTSYNWDKLAELARQAKDANETMKFNLLRDIAYDGLAKVKEETKQRVDEFVDRMFTNAKDSSARFGLKFDAEAELKDAQQRAAETPWGERLAWLEANESIISTSKPTKTRNLVIFNDKNIFRVGSEVAADPQRMKFGSDMVELGKRGQLKEKAGKTRIDTANDRAIKLLEKAAKTKDPAEAEALRAEANALFSATAGKLSGMKFGKNAVSQGLIDRNIAKLPKQAQQPVRSSINTISDWARQGLDRLVFTSDLINRAVSAGIESAAKFQSLLAKRDTKARSLEREVERVADMYAGIEEKHKGDGPNSVNQFLFESTRTGKWGYDSGKFKADPKMAAMFDALGPKAQAYVKAVFAHGGKMLSDKKKAVVDYATSEYDARIAAETDPLKKAKLVKDKANDLKRFARLFKIREGIPYAPIKRFGDHVVVAKSKEYIAAKAANDSKLVSRLEKDPDHYHVSFTETKNEARNLAEQLEAQGFFSGGTVAFKERSVADKELFGSRDSLGAITRLRAMADAKANAGDKGAAMMQRMVSDMYLQALAEGSARKSEMRRRGVSGEIDMLRSFAAQGRADANFVASVEYNPQIQDAIQAMRKEENQGSGDLNRKSEILNEITRRYESSLDATPTPTINKITRLSSIYYLATSPAYYLQNLTQPWMMSVPAMAGRHNYGKVSAALFAAYGQLGGVIKSARYDQQFDFDKVPADVRAAIQELANRGKIDIGLETELGEFKIDGDGKFSKGWNKVDKFLRISVQKVEALNRLSTAMAAYRLELAETGDKQKAIDYADRILTETHGDYSSFNAPRAFNNPIGKVALQFRKFQLIQLTYYAKLLKDAGFDSKEKRAATKALTYSLGHTALLAGAMGLPGYSAIAWAIGALFGDDDDPLDVTAELRKFIGDEDMANLIMRGAPTLAGVDISGKVGAGNMLSIMPFSQADLTTKAGVIEAAGTLLGGAPVGMVARVADGLGQMLGGEWYKGMEQVLPKGLGDAAKAYRISTEGMSRRNGDVVLPADEVSAWETAVQALGIQPVQQSVVMERQQNTLEMNQFYQDRSTKIKADYVKAMRAGESTAEARAAWNKLQEARVNNGYTRQPLSELLRAPQSQAKRAAQTVNGVQFNKTNKRFVEEQI